MGTTIGAALAWALGALCVAAPPEPAPPPPSITAVPDPQGSADRDPEPPPGLVPRRGDDPATADVSRVDASPESAEARRAAAIEVRYAPRRHRAADGPLTLAPGRSVRVGFELASDRRARPPLRVGLRTRDDRGVRVVGEAEAVEPIGTPRAPGLRFEVLVRASADAAPGARRLKLVVELSDARGRRAGGQTLALELSLVAPDDPPDSVALDRAAYRAALEAGGRARDALGPLGSRLRLDRRDAPRTGPLGAEAEARLADFVRARERAREARDRLRAAALWGEAELRTAAARVLVDLPPLEPSRGDPLAGRDSARAVTEAEGALARVELETAERLARAARTSGKLDPPGLGRALAVLGAIASLRGDEATARTELGRALCLDPTRASPSPLPPVETSFAALRAEARCTGPLRLGRLEAVREARDGKVWVDVRLPFGPDPYALVSGGDIELWGGGGAVIEVAQVRARRGPPDRLEASFEDRGDLTNVSGQLLVRLVAKDVSGVALAGIGEASPIAVDVKASERGTSPGLPWWVWVASGVAVAGAATAVALAVGSGGEPPRALGPTTITF